MHAAGATYQSFRCISTLEKDGMLSFCGRVIWVKAVAFINLQFYFSLIVSG